MRAEINEMENSVTIEKINKVKSWSLGKISKIDKLLARLIKKERKKTLITNTRNERRVISTNHVDHERY